MDEKNYKLRITFLEPVLGSQPTGAVTSEYIAKRAGLECLPEDEDLSLPEQLERGTTVFHRDQAGNFILFDYMVKGYLKNAGKVFNGQVVGGTKALRSKVNDLVFVTPRMIRLYMPLEMNGQAAILQFLERPLRAETAMGPRVALVRSEMLPSGTSFECGLTVLGDKISKAALEEILDYGYYCGLGQWRNGGYGRFRYELREEERG